MIGLVLSALVLSGPDPMLQEGVLMQSLTGCNNTAINVATQCEFRVAYGAFGSKLTTNQYHSLTLYVYYDRGGGTGYTFHLDTCIEGPADTDCTDADDWYNIMAQTASANYTDLEIKTYRRSVSADDHAVFFVGTMFQRLRAHTILCTGGGCTANDKITMKAILHADNMGVFP